MRVFSVYDKVLGEYMTPFFAKNVGLALRSFQDLVRDNRSVVAQHPADFVLYQIGTFDGTSGALSPCEPQHVANATDFIPPEVNNA